jgi:hypothetical protein
MIEHVVLAIACCILMSVNFVFFSFSPSPGGLDTIKLESVQPFGHIILIMSQPVFALSP